MADNFSEQMIDKSKPVLAKTNIVGSPINTVFADNSFDGMNKTKEPFNVDAQKEIKKTAEPNTQVMGKVDSIQKLADTNELGKKSFGDILHTIGLTMGRIGLAFNPNSAMESYFNSEENRARLRKQNEAVNFVSEARKAMKENPAMFGNQDPDDVDAITETLRSKFGNDMNIDDVLNRVYAKEQNGFNMQQAELNNDIETRKKNAIGYAMAVVGNDEWFGNKKGTQYATIGKAEELQKALSGGVIVQADTDKQTGVPTFKFRDKAPKESDEDYEKMKSAFKVKMIGSDPYSASAWDLYMKPENDIEQQKLQQRKNELAVREKAIRAAGNNAWFNFKKSVLKTFADLYQGDEQASLLAAEAVDEFASGGKDYASNEAAINQRIKEKLATNAQSNLTKLMYQKQLIEKSLNQKSQTKTITDPEDNKKLIEIKTEYGMGSNDSNLKGLLNNIDSMIEVEQKKVEALSETGTSSGKTENKGSGKVKWPTK